MLQIHRTSTGDSLEAQDPLPDNWEELAEKAGERPIKFNSVSGKHLYRSGMVWPKQVKFLEKTYGIKNIISLIDGDWLAEFYGDDKITIHQFPFNRRSDLTREMVRDIVITINGLNEPTLVHCLKGKTKTGMVCAGYRTMTEGKTNLSAIIESVRFGNLNISSFTEMWDY